MYGDTVQHLKVKTPLKVASQQTTSQEVASFLLNNKAALDEFNESIYSWVVSDSITRNDLLECVKNPNSDKANVLLYGFMSALGNSNYSDLAIPFYSQLKEKGFDAIPDWYDRFTGTSSSAMILLDPNKVQLESMTTISKDIYKNAKAYVKSIENLPISEITDKSWSDLE